MRHVQWQLTVSRSPLESAGASDELEEYPVPFGQAVSTCLSKYATFSGRARRSEYWWFYLFTLIAYVVAAVLDAVTGTPIFVVLVVLGLLLPSLAAGVRRLHDTSRSGWWVLISIIPLIGSIILLVFLASDSTPQINGYGPVPA